MTEGKSVQSSLSYNVMFGGFCFRGLAYPAAPATPLLLLLLLDELHGGGRGRSGPHGPDHLNAVLWQWGKVETLPALNLHLLEVLKTTQGELESKYIKVSKTIINVTLKQKFNSFKTKLVNRGLKKTKTTQFFTKKWEKLNISM